MVLADVRILGVLQRFAIVYGVVATIEVLFLRPKQYTLPAEYTPENRASLGTRQQLASLIYDITNFPFQWLINLSLALLWILIVYLVPFENCPAGYLGPGQSTKSACHAWDKNPFQVVCMRMEHMPTAPVESLVTLTEWSLPRDTSTSIPRAKMFTVEAAVRSWQEKWSFLFRMQNLRSGKSVRSDSHDVSRLLGNPSRSNSR